MNRDEQRVIVAGSRDVRDAFGAQSEELVKIAIEASGFEPTEIVSGGAGGVDKLGEEYADDREIDVEVFDADWERLGDMAGPKRNSEMAAYADGAVVIRVDRSAGSTDMLRKARRHLGEESVFLFDVETAAATR